MTAGELINQYAGRQPKLFSAVRITISVESLKDIIRHAHATGVEHATESLRPADDDIPEVFRSIFNRKSP